MANTIDWGKGTQNNTNSWGKYQNTIDAGSIYADSYSGETVLIGTSAAFSYAKSSYHQDETDPTPTITGTTGGTFSATPSGLSINSSTGTIDLSASTIQPYTITYTVDGVSANFSLSVTASPFLANTYSMEFDGAGSYIETGVTDLPSYVSISLWVKSTSNVWSGNPTLITRRDVPYNRYPYSISWNSGNIYAVFRIQSSSDPANGVNLQTGLASGLNDGLWHHVAAFFDGTKGSLYVDGVEISTVLVSSITNGVEGPLWPNGNPNYGVENYTTWIGKAVTTTFDGTLDEVAIWNTALSSDAVQEIYNATNNNTGKALDLNTDYNNYTSSANLQYWNRLGD